MSSDPVMQSASAVTRPDEGYRLVSVEAVLAPDGCTGRNWHLYRIAQGENEITGYRRGEIARVRVDVEFIVVALNERRQWSKSPERPKNHRRTAAAARRPPG